MLPFVKRQKSGYLKREYFNNGKILEVVKFLDNKFIINNMGGLNQFVNGNRVNIKIQMSKFNTILLVADELEKSEKFKLIFSPNSIFLDGKLNTEEIIIENY